MLLLRLFPGRSARADAGRSGGCRWPRRSWSLLGCTAVRRGSSSHFLPPLCCRHIPRGDRSPTAGWTSTPALSVSQSPSTAYWEIEVSPLVRPGVIPTAVGVLIAIIYVTIIAQIPAVLLPLFGRQRHRRRPGLCRSPGRWTARRRLAPPGVTATAIWLRHACQRRVLVRAPRPSSGQRDHRRLRPRPGAPCASASD